MIVIILLITVVSLTYFWLNWRYSYWKRKGVPGPEPVIPFGNMKESILLRNHLGLMCERWYKKYPDVAYVGIFNMTQPAVLLRDPDLIKDVLIKDFTSFDANDFPINKEADPLLATNPFVNTGAEWKRYRSLTLIPFAPNKIKMLIPSMESSCEKMVEYLKSFPKNEDVEAKTLASKFTTQNVIKCAFSIDPKCFEPEPSEFLHYIRDMFAPTFWNGLKFLVTPAAPAWLLKRLPIAMVSKATDNWIRQVISENKKSRLASGIKGNDIMQFLIEQQDKQGMTETELAGHALSLFFDGSETSSTVLAFALYELARHPEYQQRAYDEIKAVLQRHGNKLTAEAMQEMKYLDSFLSESMRLNSAAMFVTKVCTKPYSLPKLPNQKEPVTIPAGTSVTIPYKALHYDPVYYPNPEEFNPERFTDEEKNNRHKAVYLPFGEGPRMCPGMRFALAQITAALVHILKNFQLSLSPNHKPFRQEPKSILWCAKDGLLLNFTPRDA